VVKLLLAGVEVSGRGRVDVRVADARIAEVGASLSRRAGERELDGRGGALLPGLHDHHLHLRSLAAARASVHAGPPAVQTEAQLVHALRAAAAAAAPGAWLRAVGYHDSVAGPLDRHRLDAIVPDRPVRVQERSGALWILNSAALRSCTPPHADGVERDAAGEPTGRLWRMDEWLREHVPRVPLDLRAISLEAAAAGLTGFTEATPGASRGELEDLDAWARDGVLLQRVHAMTGPAGANGLQPRAITLGPVKVVLDDDALPPFDALSALVADAHRRGQAVAVHCVTRVQLVLALSAFEAAGALPGDRIEHGALIGADVVPWLARLGLTVVTQPSFIAERGDRYRLDVEAGDVDDLYRCRTLLEAGVGVAAGSDAPFGALDPWAAMRAAVTRRTHAGATLGTHERVTPEQALALFLGRRDAPAQARRIAVGEPADLCLLAVARAGALGEPSAEHVRAVVIGGRLVHGSEDI